MAGDLNFKVNFDTAQAGTELQGLLEKFVAGSEAAGNKLNRALGGTIERKVVIRTEIDEAGTKRLTSQVVTLRSEADKLKNAFASATRVDRGSITSLNQQIAQAVQARNAIQQFGQAIDLTNRKQVISAKQTQEFIDADNKVKILQQSLRNLQDADKGFGGRLTSSFADLLEKGRKLQDVVTIFQSIGIAIGAITGPIKAATNALADLDQFRLSFQAIGQGADASNGALADASRIALGLGVNIKTVRDGFQQLAPVVLNTGGSLNDVSAITESLSSRFAAFGLSTEKSRRVLNGIIQAFGKGKLQAEELTQQISEADPAFKTDLAKALVTAKNELGALGKEVDGTTSNLEGLVKQGKITAEVLRKVIPELSKSEILFGKLGPTAGSALDAFKRGRQGLDAIPVTLRQVQTNIENINQLNLEKFAKIAEPVVVSFLEIQGAVTDFITRLADIGAVKDLASVFAAIGNGIANVVKSIAAFAEGIARVISLVTPLLTFLAKIPGIAELIGVALIAKFLKPVADATGVVFNLTKAFSELNKSKDKISSTALTVDPKQSQVTLRSLEQLRKELGKPVETGIEKSLKSVDAALQSTGQVTTNLSKKQVKELNKIKSQIEDQIDTVRDWRNEVAKVESQGIRQQELIDAGGIDVVNTKIDETKSKINQVESAIADLDRGWQAAEEAQSQAAQTSASLSDVEISNIKRRIDLEGKLAAASAKTEEAILRQKEIGTQAYGPFTRTRTNERSYPVVPPEELARVNEAYDKQTKVVNALEQEQANLAKELDAAGGAIDRNSNLFRQYENAVSGAARSSGEIISQNRLAGLSVKELEQELTALQGTLKGLEQDKYILNFDASKSLADAKRGLELELQELKKLASKQLKIESPVTAVKATDVSSKVSIDTAEIKTAGSLIDEFKNKAKQSYVEAQLGSQEYVKQAREEIAILDKRIASLKEASKSTSKLPIAVSGASTARDELLDLTKRSDDLKSSLAQLGASFDRTYANIADYGDVLGKIDSGAKLSSLELRNLALANDIVGKAASGAADRVKQLTTQQSSLSALVKKLGLELGSLPAFDIRAGDIKGELEKAKLELASVTGELNAASGAAQFLESESKLVGTALQQAGQSRGQLQKLKDLFADLSNSPNAFAKSFGRAGTFIGGVVTSIGNGIKSLGASLKAFAPELLFFAAISTAVAAYSRATESARKVQESNQQTTQKLESTIKDLTVSYSELTGRVESTDFKKLTPQLSGLEVVLISLGGVIKTVIDLFKKLFDTIKGSTIDPITGQVQKTSSAFEQLAAGLGAIGTAALVGSRFGPWVAGAAAVAATAVVLTAALNDTGAKIDELKNKGTAIRQGYKQEIVLLKQLTAQIALFGDEYLKAKQAAEETSKKGGGLTGGSAQAGKDVQFFSKTLAAYGTLVERFNALGREQKNALNDFRQGEQLAFRLNNEIRLLEEKINSTDARKREKAGDQGYRQGIKNEIDAKKKQLEVILQANAESAASERLLKAELKALEAELDRLSKKYGLLSKEELATANNTSNLNAKLKEAKAALELLDFDKQKKQFDKVATSVGTIQAQIDRLENAAKQRELAGYIDEVKKQLADGKIPTSLANIEKLVQSLEQRSMLLDINSPELPKVLQDLLKAQQFTDQLDGKKAQITLELIDKGLKEGSLKDTLALRERQLSELGKVKQSSPINSKEYQQALEAEKKLSDQKKTDEMTIDELRSSLADKQKERIENISQVEKDAHDRKIEQLDKQKEKIEKIYDAQIKAAESQKGPAETELAKLQKQDLEAKAKQPGRSGLEARAELERLAREEEVARLKEEKEKKLQEIADKKAAIEEATVAKEYQLLDDRLAVEAQIAKLRGAAIDKEIGNLQNTLKQRTSGTAGTGATGTSAAAVPGGTQAAVDAAQAAGEQAGQAYNKGYTMVIQRSDTPTNDPAAKVKYDYQDPGVISAKEKRNQLESEYQALLTATQNLELQANAGAEAAGTRMVDPSLSAQIVSNYQRLSALQIQIAQSEQTYSDALQSTKSVTGQIVITNQSLAQSFSDINSKKPAIPVDPARLSQAYALTQQLNAAWDAQGAKIRALKVEYDKTTDPTKRQALLESINAEAKKLDEIKAKTFAARDAYGQLRQQAQGAGQEQILPDNIQQIKQDIQDWAKGISSASDSSKGLNTDLATAADKNVTLSDTAATAAASFVVAADAVSNGLLPAIEQVTPQLNDIQNQMNAIFDRAYTVDVALNVQRQGLWTGGPATAGTVYKVNELGQEGFMNRSGRVTPINKARNSLWRAPGDGFVIPADIYGQMTATGVTAPATKVSHNSPRISGGVDPMRTVAKMTAALAASMTVPQSTSALNELAKVQTYQAREIGRLSRAVQELNEKDWNVNVKVRNNSNLAYLQALNHRL